MSDDGDDEFWPFLVRAGGVLLAMLLGLAAIALLLTSLGCASTTRHGEILTVHRDATGQVTGTDTTTQAETTTHTAPPLPGPGTVRVVAGLLGLPPGVTEGIMALLAAAAGKVALGQAKAKNKVVDAYRDTVTELAQNGHSEEVIATAKRCQEKHGARATVRRRLTRTVQPAVSPGGGG